MSVGNRLPALVLPLAYTTIFDSRKTAACCKILVETWDQYLERFHDDPESEPPVLVDGAPDLEEQNAILQVYRNVRAP